METFREDAQGFGMGTFREDAQELDIENVSFCCPVSRVEARERT